MDSSELQARIEALIAEPAAARTGAGAAIDEVIAGLDDGRLRVSEPDGDGWVTHAWIKSAILLYFTRMDVRAYGDPQPFGMPVAVDKLPLKTNFAAAGVRCVPGGVVRYGSYLARGVIVMPGFVNIGAYVDEGSMVDTWATVGSCAQIGKGVHLSGGVGIGGVLEPPQAQPVVIEDGAFIGSRCIVVEGVRIGREAVLGAGVTITASTPIVDVRGSEPVTTKGAIPPRSVVIPGSLPKRFPAGEFGTPCALIIGTRSESTDRKTSLNATLREFEVAV